MNKPEDYTPGVQRYSADHDASVSAVSVLYFGIQNSDSESPELLEFQQKAKQLLRTEHGPTLFDFAQYVDPSGFTNYFAVAYWYSNATYESWMASPQVRDWWESNERVEGTSGYFREAFSSSLSHTETIAFKEYVRGLSACPMNSVKPMGESGYWGAARDRVPASAYEKLDSAVDTLERVLHEQPSSGVRLSVAVPENMCVIRSGVSWTDCGIEQLQSYLSNLKPVLDKGMDFLRQNPQESGCLCLRQVDCVTHDNKPMTENYCAGYFLSLKHLESWAKSHPTHLAIYGKAQNERMKYQEKLELRTYHEVYVIDQPSVFEYVNCHALTGILPFCHATVSIPINT